MQHKTNQHKGFNKQQKIGLLGFILGAFILSPLVKVNLISMKIH